MQHIILQHPQYIQTAYYFATSTIYTKLFINWIYALDIPKRNYRYLFYNSSKRQSFV